MITQAALKEIIHYDPETGIFTWKVNRDRAGNAKAGSQAGGIHGDGYRRISINNRPHAASHIAWLYMTGEWPTKQIDFINDVMDDTRWCNLVQSELELPQTDVRRRGLVRRPSGRYGVRVRHGRSYSYHGTFDTIEEASAVYQAVKAGGGSKHPSIGRDRRGELDARARQIGVFQS